MLTVLLVDDHPVILNGIAHYLASKEGITVVGKATNLTEATTLLKQYPVDVIVCDMNVDDEHSGMEVLMQVKKNYPATKLIFYTMIATSSQVREAILAGADGYVLKKYDADEVFRAIETVRANKPYYSQELVQILVRVPAESARQDEQPLALKSLTSRELEVMILIAKDLSTAKIAKKLSVTESTVNTHRTNVMQKLNVTSNVGITHYAFKYKLIDQDGL